MDSLCSSPPTITEELAKLQIDTNDEYLSVTIGTKFIPEKCSSFIHCDYLSIRMGRNIKLERFDANFFRILKKYYSEISHYYIDFNCAFQGNINRFIENFDYINELEIMCTLINDQDIDSMPNNIKKLDIYIYSGNNLRLLRFPTELESFSLRGCLDNISPIFPPKLKICNLIGSNFNQPLNNINIDLEELLLGEVFNQPLENLPLSLKRLTIKSEYFDQPLCYLPNLEELELNLSNKTYKNNFENLPVSLKKLKINFPYLDNNGLVGSSLDCLPDGIKDLEISYRNFPVINKFPANLKKLVYHECPKLVKKNIRKIINISIAS